MLKSQTAFQYQVSPPVGRFIERFTYWCFEIFLWNSLFRWRTKVHGSPPDAAFVLVSNHGSYLDWLFTDVILRRKFRREVFFLAKRKVVGNLIWDLLARHCKTIVFADSAKTKAIVLASHILTNGNSTNHPIVGIFPEGTRSRTGEQIAHSEGAAWLAKKHDTLIVPVALCGFWEAWPPQRKFPCLKKQRLAVHFLNPIRPADFPDEKTAMDFAMNQIYAVVKSEREASHRKRFST